MPTDNVSTCFFPPSCWECASQANLLTPYHSWLCGSWNTCSCDFWLTYSSFSDWHSTGCACRSHIPSSVVCCHLWTTPHVADNVIVFQVFNSCINLINIVVLQGGFFVFCKLGWGEPDVFIAVRGHDYDWVVVVESLFENQRNIGIVGVNKRSFAVLHITQKPLRECCRMVKTIKL